MKNIALTDQQFEGSSTVLGSYLRY